MATINTFEELEIWQLSREICKDVWNAFENTSLGKDFELKNQMNRSSGSIMDNIAEGFERNGRREFINFLSYSKGSCGELRSQLYRAFDRKHITEEEFEFLKEKTITESKKIGSFMAYLVKSDNNGSKFDKK
ncbi:MAG TPA: four helix bundle protein [Flavobacterium sp.]|uniref:four helix bundle protein n=1 Tax=unclassified Flavobacterium TaxID=196869 RepID=UPI000E9E51A8|nr:MULTISPECIES: four helix bundle protein [unclassified Flavobacterium]HBI01789.1 four helix bundle protein [Flavobacterium sp.]HRE76573.1 four helix bundle protein [Flavobacterium sp.]